MLGYRLLRVMNEAHEGISVEASRLHDDRCIAIGVLDRTGMAANRRTESKSGLQMALLRYHRGTRRGIVMVSLFYGILHKPLGFFHVHTQYIAEIYNPKNTMLSAKGNSDESNTYFAFRASSSLRLSNRSIQACQACALLSGTTDLMRILNVPLTGR